VEKEYLVDNIEEGLTLLHIFLFEMPLMQRGKKGCNAML
jgi:hypothetical protein